MLCNLLKKQKQNLKKNNTLIPRNVSTYKIYMLANSKQKVYFIIRMKKMSLNSDFCICKIVILLLIIEWLPLSFNFYFDYGFTNCWRKIIVVPDSPGGVAYQREVTPPDWVIDYWHPLEKAQYPEYFARREQRKKEFVKLWEQKYGKEPTFGHH